MTAQRILVADTFHTTLYDILSKAGYETISAPTITPSDLSTELKDFDALAVRSKKIHDVEFGNRLKAIGRGGAGVNNIPVARCAKEGIVVFNAPGANSNTVAEYTIGNLLTATRMVFNAYEWMGSLHGDELGRVEKEKSRFKGTEIYGKTISVIGLGQIGRRVAKKALDLGMRVKGYDKHLTVPTAIKVDSRVEYTDSIEQAVSGAAYVTFHVPATEETKGFVDSRFLSFVEPGTGIINFARDEIVDKEAMKDAIERGIVSWYMADFPQPWADSSAYHGKVIALPHLGASSEEAGVNCAQMIANQFDDFLSKGIILNSVNYPAIYQQKNGGSRIAILNQNIEGVLHGISNLISNTYSLNIAQTTNRSQGDYAATIYDITSKAPTGLVEMIEFVPGVLKAREL